jgi:predicted metal-dependent hydrolase
MIGNLMGYSPLYVQFVYYFNVERDYFECHEVLEELWLEEGRDPLYQGLLQVAVGLYHFRNDNLGGAIKLLTAAVEKLEGCKDIMLGINMASILAASKAYLQKLKGYETAPFEFYDLTIEVVDSELERLVQAYVENPPSHEDEDET